MDRREQHAALLPLADRDLENALPVICGDACEAVIGYAEPYCVVGMNFDVRLGQMLAQTRAGAATRHGMPFIPDAAGVQPQRPSRTRLGSQRRNFRRNEACFAVVCKEATVGKKPPPRRGI